MSARRVSGSWGSSEVCQQATTSRCHVRHRLVATSAPRPQVTQRPLPPPRQLRPPGRRRRRLHSAQPQQTAPPCAPRTTPAPHASIVELRLCCRAACSRQDIPRGAARSATCCWASLILGHCSSYWSASTSRAAQILRTYLHMLDPLSTCCHAPGGCALALFSSGLRADRDAAEGGAQHWATSASPGNS